MGSQDMQNGPLSFKEMQSRICLAYECNATSTTDVATGVKHSDPQLDPTIEKLAEEQKPTNPLKDGKVNFAFFKGLKKRQP